MIKQYDHLFKIVIIGNQSVGKSSIFVRFNDNHFSQTYLATVGVDFRFKILDVQGQQCKLQIWDTAGQERFRNITSAYYKGSQAVIIVYDLTDEESLKSIQEFWINEVRTNGDKNVYIVMAGNKKDLERKISQEDIFAMSIKLAIDSFQISAKTNQGVNQLFQAIALKLIQSNEVQKKPVESTKLGNQGRQKKSNCFC